MSDIARRSVLTAGALGAAAFASGATAQSQPTPTEARPLSGQVALVTGGARGLGRATAVELARLGADVAVLDIARPDAIPLLPYPLAGPDDLAETIRLIQAQGVRALAIAADVRDLASVERAFAQARGELGRIDIVHANAGVGLAADTLENFRPETFLAVQAVNVLGVANTLKAAAAVITAPGGRIVVTTSREGREASKSWAYSPSKWAASSIMKNAAQELGPRGVTVNGVAPGAADTPLIYRQWGGEFTPERRETMNRNVDQATALPVGMVDPIDVARAVAYLVGPGGRYITGATIDVNAGRTAASVV